MKITWRNSLPRLDQRFSNSHRSCRQGKSKDQASLTDSRRKQQLHSRLNLKNLPTTLPIEDQSLTVELKQTKRRRSKLKSRQTLKLSSSNSSSCRMVECAAYVPCVRALIKDRLSVRQTRRSSLPRVTLLTRTCRK